jgi:hypothetical protein
MMLKSPVCRKRNHERVKNVKLKNIEKMTAAIEKKYKLIQMIMSVEDDETLSSIEASITQTRSGTKSEASSFWRGVKPIRKGVSFQEILSEQGYQPLTYEEFRKKADEIDMQEPIEDLLAQLTQ